MTLVVAYVLTGSASLYFLAFKKKVLSPRLFHSGSVSSWKKVLHVGLPSIVNNLAVPLPVAFATWMVADLGKEAVAALGVSTRIENFAVLIFYATGAGMSSLIGQNFGAGNYGRVSETVRIAARYALMWGLAIAGILWLTADKIPLFFTTHPQVVAYTAQYLHIVPLSYAGTGLMIVSNGALNAMGKPLPATALVLVRALVIYIPLAYFAEKAQGFTGILVALAATNILIGIIAFLWNKKLTP